MRAPVNIDELSAIAFTRSPRPTKSAMNACRAGMSSALTIPTSAPIANTCHTCTRRERHGRKRQRQQHGQGLRRQQDRMTPARIRSGSADWREQEDGDLPGESDQAQQSSRARQPVHEP
jgi:hypothetical protein